MTTNCKRILCGENPPIEKRKDFLKWSISNHPDRFNNESESIKAKQTSKFQKMLDCQKTVLSTNSEKITCSSSPQESNRRQQQTSSPKSTSKATIKKSTCLRTSENWTHIDKEHRFDKQSFNPKKMLEDIPKQSPKMQKMIDNIRTLDKDDMDKHGKLFKHFIFSDVKAGGHGAKIIASSLIANGFNSCFKPRTYHKIELQTPTQNDDKETFGLLCSTSLFNNTYTKAQIRQILKTYNSRPENIYGDRMRFMIFDSGFKEGIDLFDVKYVHIFEMQHNSADLTQAVGRATRSCGQKGLDFVPNKGWTLHVYQYYSTYSKPISRWGDKMNEWYDNENNPQTPSPSTGVRRIFDKYLQYKGVDLNKLVFKENLEKLAIISSIDYDLNYNINKFENNATEEMEKLLELEYQPLNRGGNNDTMFGCNGGKCGSRSTKTIPFSLGIMEQVYRESKKKPPSNYKSMMSLDKRKFFCDLLKTDSNYCEKVNNHYSEFKNKKVKAKKTKKGNTVKKNDKQLIVLDNSSTKESVNNYISNIDMKHDVPKEEDLDDLTFEEFQERINKIFRKYKYPPIKIENQCIDNNNEGEGTDEQNILKSRIVKFTESQQFIPRYFTPNIKQKGLLVWHSVGTGKTCTALATKSFMYEKKDYSILWVTRTTLREDIWKNMFDKVCDHVIRQRLIDGEDIPSDPDKIRKYMHKKFLPPMSYRQFSNTLLKKNDTSNTLINLNGENDMLKKTLIIIDEAHKLYGNDLISAERPNMEAIQSMIFNSYKKSGKDSCKLMLMTATPIADDSMEFMKLLNLLIGKEENRLPTSFNDIKSEYLEEGTNKFSTNGKKKFQKRIKGLISYLNRRYDPRQFTQPVFHNVPVRISEIPASFDKHLCKAKATEDYNTCLEKDLTSDLTNTYNESKMLITSQLDHLKEDLLTNKKEIKEAKSIIKSKNSSNTQKESQKQKITRNESRINTINQEIKSKKLELNTLKIEYKQNLKDNKKEVISCKKQFTIDKKLCEKMGKDNHLKYQDTKFMICDGILRN